MATDPDFAAMNSGQERLSDELRQAQMTANDQTYRAVSPDRQVRVTVDGQQRVTSLSLAPTLLRQGPDTVDRLITRTTNDAMAAARSGSWQALLDGLPPGLRAAVESALDQARRR